MILGYGLKCQVCSSPELVKERSYHDVKGYKYGICNDSIPLGDEIECPYDTNSCGTITFSVNKQKLGQILEELKHVMPNTYTRQSLTIPYLKQTLLRAGRGPRRRPTDGNIV